MNISRVEKQKNSDISTVEELIAKMCKTDNPITQTVYAEIIKKRIDEALVKGTLQ